MNLLARLRRSAAKGSRGSSPEEVRVLQRVLQGGDPRFELLIEQLRTTPAVTRERPTADTFRVSPTSTFEDLNFVFEVTHLQSAWVPVEDVHSGRRLEFRVAVARSGFLEVLEGRTADGSPWPDVWDAAPPGASPPAVPALVLPSLAEMEVAQARARADLEAWLAIALPPKLTLYPPVTEAAVRLCEEDLGVWLTVQHVELLAITDGLEWRQLRLLGHADLRLLDDPAHRGIVVAWDSDDTDEFIVTQAGDGTDQAVLRVDVHDRKRRRREMAPDLRSYLRAALSSR